MKTCSVLLGRAPSGSSALAADGKAIFKSDGCTTCHAADKKIVRPPLKEIAARSGSKRDELVAFLPGKRDPRVDPDDFATRKPALEKTKALTDSDRTALADFTLSHE
jgi:cytochrome c